MILRWLTDIFNVNESNDKWYGACQRTQPYSINVRSTYGKLDKVNAIKAYYLHLHNGAIRNLSSNPEFERVPRERTTNAASICVAVNMAKKKEAFRLTNMGPSIQILTTDPIVGIWNLAKSDIEVCSGHYESISNTVDKI